MTQRFGYAAAMSAATSPVRGPSRRRPASPITSTAVAPMTQLTTRCANQLGKPRNELIESAAGYSGGWKAVAMYRCDAFQTNGSENP